MKRVCLAVTAAALCCGISLSADDLPPGAVSVSYSREKGLVAAAFQGGQVVLWEFDSGHVKKVFNASAPRRTLNLPLAHFSVGGGRLAFTQEGDTGLIAYDIETGASSALVPHRLLVRGITAFSWSPLADTVLVAIGHDIFLINAAGRTQWQRRLETRAIITDVAWHPSGKFYTAATDDGALSTWETATGRLGASSKIDTGAHPTPVKVGWTSEDSLVASVRGVSLAVLDPETLKPKKTTACNCLDFTWSPNGKELFAWSPPGISVFTSPGSACASYAHRSMAKVRLFGLAKAAF